MTTVVIVTFSKAYSYTNTLIVKTIHSKILLYFTVIYSSLPVHQSDLIARKAMATMMYAHAGTAISAMVK